MLIGHSKNLKDLRALIASGDLGQSYLFVGPSMVGKKSVAMAFAKFLEKGEFDIPVEGEVLQDMKLIDLAFMKAMDADTKDSIGIDAAREAKHFLSQRPAVAEALAGRPAASARRVLIIDDAESLTTEAQNALLKVTEEPPADSLIIFIASDADSILPTILSRVQKIYFGTVNKNDMEKFFLSAIRYPLSAHPATQAETGKAIDRSFGKPGLAWRLLFDESLKQQLALAEKYLKTTPAARRDFIKELIEPDDFSLRQFLSAVILQLAWQKNKTAVAPVWHKALDIYDGATNFGLNPRLQLESLLISN